MLNKRLEYAKDVAKELLEVEATCDQLVAQVGQLMTRLSAGRTSANVSAVMGQNAFSSVGAIAPAAIAVRGLIVDAHHQLRDFQHQAGLDAYNLGGGWFKAEERGKAPFAVVRHEEAA